jgi:hypothetical protein
MKQQDESRKRNELKKGKKLRLRTRRRKHESYAENKENVTMKIKLTEEDE